MRLTLAGVLAICGCYAPTIADGSLPCSSDKRCPQGFVCQPDDRCWMSGDGSDGGVPDAAHPPDVAVSRDGGAPDLSLPDLSLPDLPAPDLSVDDQSVPDDLTLPPDQAVPLDRSIVDDLASPQG